MIGNATSLTVGPPGTGKTTRCIDIIERELKSGLSPHRIACVTFTKAAAEEAKARAENVCKADFPWFRTIHSMAFKLSFLSPDQVMQAEHWAEFAHAYGYRFTISSVSLDSEVLASSLLHTPDDRVRAIYDWARNTQRTFSQALAQSSLRVSPDALRKYGTRYDNYKRSRGLVDYIDMIELALDDRPDVDVAVIDEAQDLSPLQIDAVTRWFGSCRRVYVAGDDDQSIYGFQGAAPDWIVQLSAAPDVETTVLRQSRRVPRAPHAFAQAIIRKNRHRVSKQYLPRDEDGRVDRLPFDCALRSIDPSRSAFVLVRNRCFGDGVIDELRRLDVPYRSTIGWPSPMDPQSGIVGAVRAARKLVRGECLFIDELQALVHRLPSRGADLIPHGLKSYLSVRAKETPYLRLTSTDVKTLLVRGSLLDVLAARGLSGAVHGRDLDDARYIERVLARYGEDCKPKVEVATIHASKGREAEQVLVLPDQTRATFDEGLDARRGGREAENRVAYVAATRTLDRLVVVHGRSKFSYAYPHLK